MYLLSEDQKNEIIKLLATTLTYAQSAGTIQTLQQLKKFVPSPKK